MKLQQDPVGALADLFPGLPGQQVTNVSLLRDLNRVSLPLMPMDFTCRICELPEKRCTCERYCGLCQSPYDARLCEDGQYYCRPCREACDLAAQYQTQV